MAERVGTLGSDVDPSLSEGEYFRENYIKSRHQLKGEIVRGGVVKLFHDGQSIARDLIKGAREMVELRYDPVYDGLKVPKGDGSPVAILGGFGSSQAHYFDSAHSISHANYEVRTLPWGHANVKNPLEMAKVMMPEITRYKKETGHRIKLVVHSLGGYDAAAMFAIRPQEFVDSVEHVVFVASPRPAELNSALALSYLVLHMFDTNDEFEMTDKINELDEVVGSGLLKVTSIGSSEDPIVRGQHLARNEQHYVIDDASHCALGMNKHTVRTIAHAFVGEEVDEIRFPNIHHPNLQAA